MSKRDPGAESAESLRKRAESASRNQGREGQPVSAKDTAALLHELEVHQIELEMQNDELRRAQAELEESRAHLSDLYDFAPVGYLTLTQEGVVVQANLRAAMMLGVERSGLIGKRFSRFLMNDSQDAFYHYWRSLRNGSHPQTCDLLLRRRERGPLPVSMETVDPPSPDGNIEWRCAIADITQRKRAERELLESRADLARQLEDAHILQWLSGLLIKDENDESLYGSILDAAMTVVRADFSGMQLFDARSNELRLVASRNLNPESVDLWSSLPAEAGTLCASALRYGRRIVVPDVRAASSIMDSESQRQYLLSGIGASQSTPLTTHHGRVMGVISTHWRRRHEPSESDLALIDVVARLAADALERKAAQKALREAHERLGRVLESDTVGILFLEPGGSLMDANEAFLKMSGYSHDEIRSRRLHWRTLTPAEWTGESEAQMEKLAATGRIGPYEKEYIRKDGSRRWLLIAGRDLGDGSICKYCIDITDRKKAEKALHEEDKRKNEFLALLGHELRNPLAALSASLQILPTASPEQRAELQEIMGRQLTLTQRLVDDLLDIERIRHGHIELQKAPVDLSEFLCQATASMQSSVLARRQTLMLKGPDEPVRFMADPVRLGQILSNLLGNASRYTPAGGRIELSGGREGSEIVFRCRDNGQGIPAESLEKIFEPFTRGSNTVSGSGEASLGIGLALARLLTQLHGGTVRATSGGVGMGSEFTLRLPLILPETESASAERPESPRQKHSIVVVEDNPAVRRLMQLALEQAGYDVHVFSDGPSLLSGIGQLKADTVLLDIGLPGMSGYELAAMLKQYEHLRGARVIAISGFRERPKDDKRELFDRYLLKPVDIRDLLDLVEAPMNGKPAATEPVDPAEAGPFRVLLVEDHPDVASLTAMLLREAGVEVLIVATAQEAIEAVPTFRPHLVLCDMNLPDMKGTDLVRALKSAPSAPAFRSVIITARSAAEIATYNKNAANLGVDEFVSKPLKPKTVRTLMSKLKLPPRPGNGTIEA